MTQQRNDTMSYRWMTFEERTLPALIRRMEEYLGHAVNALAVELALRKNCEIFGGYVNEVPTYWHEWPGDCLIKVSVNGEVMTHGHVQPLKGECLRWYSDIIMISQLVAQTYIPNEFSYANVRHLDSNPRNNLVDNLEWYPHPIWYNYHLGDVVTSSVAKLAQLTGHSTNSIVYSYQFGTDLGVYRTERIE